MTDFIEVYPEALSVSECRQIVERFEASGQAVQGRTGSGVDLTLKNSFDITLANKPEWKAEVVLLQKAVFRCLHEYIRKHRFALIGPLGLRVERQATQVIELVNDANFDTLNDEELTQMLLTAFRCGSINLQKYLADQGGYPHWHSELYPKDASCETLHRILLFTFYLNDGFSDGATEFFYQSRKIQPRTGSLLIAPAGFTHTHRGNMPVGGDKYIATSWILFTRAERLYVPS